MVSKSRDPPGAVHLPRKPAAVVGVSGGAGAERRKEQLGAVVAFCSGDVQPPVDVSEILSGYLN